MSRSLILASASPRRAQLLEQIGVVFRVMPADIDETPRPDEGAEAYVGRLAIEKAAAIAARNPGHVVLAADTTVVVDEHILGKPDSADECETMLRKLSGRAHEVYTGIAVHSGDSVAQTVTRSRVHFRSIDKDERVAYWHSGEPKDKAGGYAIQGLGAMFVQRIEGSYSGVVGLPLAETAQYLSRCDVATGLSVHATDNVINAGNGT
ncbi:MAG: nucleoside triphosphate pyrophosphatase [Gammaproteobacteria bacterium]